MLETKPFSQACENNKKPILDILKQYIGSDRISSTHNTLIEVGSGTGQHATFLSEHLPHILWQPTDRQENLAGIEMWLQEANLPNLLSPLEYDVTQAELPPQSDHLFTANTLHIMSWAMVEQLFAAIPDLINSSGYGFFYGPFKYGGDFTTPSNENFDAWLKQQVAHQGIRDFEAVTELANQAGMRFIEDVSMPANNQLLIFQMR